MRADGEVIAHLRAQGEEAACIDRHGCLRARAGIVPHEHAARVVARQRDREAAERRQRGGEVAVGIGRAHHAAVQLFGDVLVPGDGLVVEAPLQRQSCLYL